MMENGAVAHIEEVIAHMEAHLNEKTYLAQAAQAAHYSQYHFHRMFAHVVGMTPHDYLRRRQLTEAARLLVFSETPIMELALRAGYAGQQAFTSVFKAMYKQTPAEYRKKGVFYPLQLPPTLHPAPVPAAQQIARATMEDIPDWENFITSVMDGFPCLEEAPHRERLRNHIRQRQVLIARDGRLITGAAAFSPRTGSIEFLAVHPQYRRFGTARALLELLAEEVPAGRMFSITTFREGDKADTGQRAAYKQLGFTEAELLVEFGYPVQRLVLPRGQKGEDGHDG